MKDIYQNKEKIQFTGTFWGESNNLEKVADKGTKIIEKMIRIGAYINNYRNGII